MELFLFFLYLIVWLGLTLKRKRFERYFSIFFIFGLAGFAYFTLIPLEMYIKDEEYFFVHHWIKLGATERNLILLMSIIALFGFYFGLKLSRYRLFPTSVNLKDTYIRTNKRYFSWIIGILSFIVVMCGFILIIFYRDLLLSQYDYTTAYGITYKSPLYSLIKMHFVFGLALIAGVISIRRDKWMRMVLCTIIIVLIILVGALTADKDPILLALLSCTSFFKFDKMSFKRFLAISIIGSTCVIILVLSFNVYRTRLPLGAVINNLTLSPFSFTQLDPAGPMVSIVDTVDDDFLQLRYGSTYLNSLGVLIPKILWSNRPLDLSEEFARENIVDWSEGQGLGYSPLAEAYVNFSIPGAFIHFFIFGFLMGGILHVLRKWLFVKHSSILIRFIYILGYYIVIISFRAPLIGPIKMLVLFMMPYCILFILIKEIGKIVHDSRQRFLNYQSAR